MEGTILFQDVYEAINSGEAFDAVVVSCDRKRGTGGNLIRLEGWMAHLKRETSNPKAEPSTEESIHRLPEKETKDPKHDVHGTLNVYNPADAAIRPRTIHWDLIRIFNGKRVIN